MKHWKKNILLLIICFILFSIIYGSLEFFLLSLYSSDEPKIFYVVFGLFAFLWKLIKKGAIILSALLSKITPSKKAAYWIITSVSIFMCLGSFMHMDPYYKGSANFFELARFLFLYIIILEITIALYLGGKVLTITNSKNEQEEEQE